MTTGRRDFLVGLIPTGYVYTLGPSTYLKRAEPLGHCGVDPAHECKEQQATAGATMNAAHFAISAPQGAGSIAWDLEQFNDAPALYVRRPSNVEIDITQPGLYLVSASVLVVAAPGSSVDVDLYVHGSIGYPTGRVDSYRVMTDKGGWASARLNGVFRLDGVGVAEVQTDVGMIVGGEDLRWTGLSLTKLA